MGRIVIAAYRPRPGRANELAELLADHAAMLCREGFATDRAPVLMHAADGTVVEVFEWRDRASIEAAHESQRVLGLWERIARVATYVPVADVPEAANLFSEFSSEAI